MGYYIKYNEMRSAQNSIFTQINQWVRELEKAKEKLQDVAMMQEIKGDTANSIRSYILEVHFSLLNYFHLVMDEYKNQMQKYNNDYKQLDNNISAKISIDRLEEQLIYIQVRKTAFQEIEEKVANAVGIAAGLANVSVPSGMQIIDCYENLGYKVAKLRLETGNLEYGHLNNDFNNIEEMISNILQMIHSQIGKGNITITKYHLGSIAKIPVYQKLQKTIDKQKQYLNSDDCKSILSEKNQWSKVDELSLEKSVDSDKVFISENGKYIFYHGEVYPIYVPDYTKQVIEAQWETVEIKKYSKHDFDAGMFLLGISWDDVEDKELFTKDLSNKLLDNNVKGQGLLTILNVSETFIKSLENTIIKVNFQQSDGNKRAVISVYNSSDFQTLSSFNYNTPISKRREQKKLYNDWAALKHQSDYAKGICEIVTGKICKEAVYDIEVTLDDRHKTQGTTGFLSYDVNGKLLYTPVVFSGDKAVVGTRVGLFETQFEPIADFSDYLNQPSYASEDYQKILEKMLEGK